MRYLALIILFSSCNLTKKCAERFPIKEEIREVLVIDTILTQGDTIYKLIKDTLVPVICPPSKIITKIKEVKITAENTAKTHLLKQDHQKQIDKLNDECDRQKDSLNAELKKRIKEIDKLNNKLNSVKKFKQWFYILLLGIIVTFAIKLRKLFFI